jgi:MFS family permease
VSRSRLLVDVGPLRRHRQFRRLWTGYVVSVLGSQVTVVALPYQVYRLTHSSLDVGLIGMAQILPVLGGGLVGGSIADALDRRRVLLSAQAVMASCSVLLCLNAFRSHPGLWPLYALGALSAGAATVDSSGRSAAIAGLLDRREFASGNALWQLLYQFGQVAGPALAGILIAQVSLGAAYALDAATFLASAGAVASLHRLPPGEGGASFGLSSMAEGLRFLRGRQALQGAFVIDLNAMVLGMPRALFPALALLRFHGGARTVGFLYAAPSVGALIGALLTGWVTSVHRQGRAVLIAVAVWGAAILAFGVVTSLPGALALLAVAGAADVVSAVFRGTILQSESPPGLRGRLSAIHIAVVTGGPRLGDFEAGAVAALAGPEVSVVSGGLGCVAGVALVGWLMPKLRSYVPALHEGRAGEPELDGLVAGAGSVKR